MKSSLTPVSRLTPIIVVPVVFLAGACATQADIEAWERSQALMAASRAEAARTLAPPAHADTRDFREALDLPPERFDLALALLLFAKEYGGAAGDVVESRLKLIDQWAGRLRSRVRSMRSLEQKVYALRDMVHDELGFSYDGSDPRGMSPGNLFFDRVLERKRGYCVTLSLVYLVLARGADLPLYGVRLPGHFAVAYDDNSQQVVLETTAEGRPRGRIELYTSYVMSAKSVDQTGVYLNKLSDREIFSTLYNNLGGLRLFANDDGGAREGYLKAIDLAPANIEARYNLARSLMRSDAVDDLQNAMAQLNESISLDPHFYHGYCARAGLYDRCGEPEKAQADLRKAKGLRPNLGGAYVEEGVIRYRNKDIKAAKESFELALAREPDNLDALRNLSIVEGELGNAERSKELAERYELLTKRAR
ncbi:MAG: hypothetical protein HUU29_12670 [Planctomycetaceae bacterium]|nr:hypothetical protein [Planctomycetaceae bacterium]